MSQNHRNLFFPEKFYYLGKVFNLPLDYDGSCYGLGCMFIQAALVQDLQTFAKRIKAIDHLLNGCCVAIDNAYPDLDKESDQFKTIMNKVLSDAVNRLPEDVRQDYEIFCQSVAIHQDPNSPHFLPLNLSEKIGLSGQNASVTLNLLEPVNLSKKDPVIVSLTETDSGLYFADEVESLFVLLDVIIREEIKKHYNDTGILNNQPIAFLLSSSKHTIAMSYNLKYKFYDPNDPVIEYDESTEKIAENVYVALDLLSEEAEKEQFNLQAHAVVENFHETLSKATSLPQSPNLNKSTKDEIDLSEEEEEFPVIFNMEFYTTKNQQAFLEGCLKKIYEHPIWKGIHKVTKEKAGITDKSGNTWLHSAVDSNDVETVRKLCAFKSNLNTKDEFKSTPLYYALEQKNPEIIRLLIDAEAQTDLLCGPNQLPTLHYAVKICDASIIDLVLNAKNIEIDLLDLEFKTPLHHAILRGDSTITSLLLLRGADPNKMDNTGCTPLYIASKTGNTELVLQLLHANASVNIGLDPIKIAIAKGHVSIAEIIETFPQRLTSATPNLFMEQHKRIQSDTEQPDSKKSKFNP